MPNSSGFSVWRRRQPSGGGGSANMYTILPNVYDFATDDNGEHVAQTSLVLLFSLWFPRKVVGLKVAS